MNGPEILQKIKNNDQRVIADFYKSHRNEFIAYAMKKYRVSADICKEIYQEAFLAMYRNIITGKLIQLQSSLKTYLFQIGKNQIMNELKRSARSVDVDGAEFRDNSIQHKFDDSGENDLIKLKKINMSLLKLSEKCRELLRLFYFEKKKHDEIMLIMNYTTIDSVKTQKYKCFKKLENLVKSDFN